MNKDTDRLIEIAPGVRCLPVRTPTLPPATHTNVWVLGNRQVTVVDAASPYADQQQRLAAALSDLKVERIVLTHHHLDHVSGATDLRDRTGAPIHAHPLTHERVGFPVDGELNEGDTIETDAGQWVALHTPGHATGHLCLHNRSSGSMVAGDMVAGEGTIVLDPPEGDLSLYLDSLSRLRDLQPEHLLPAHGPVLHDPVVTLTTYIEHRHARTVQVLNALTGRGLQHPSELVPRIYTEVHPMVYPIAARQVLCHLQWLESEGQVEREGELFRRAAPHS